MVAWRALEPLARSRSVGAVVAIGSTVALTYTTTWLALPIFVFEHLSIMLVLIVAIVWGLGPAVVAVVAAVAGDNILLREPIGRPTITGSRDLLDLLLFATVAVVVSGLVTRAQKARVDAEAAATRERQAREDLDRLIATVAHDLATPLQVLDTSVRFARLKGGEQVDWVRLLERLATASARATSLVRMLSDVKAVHGDAPALALHRHDLRELVAPIVQMMDRFSDRHPVIFAPAAEAVPVEADAERLQRLVENLVSNAIKYSPGGGTVEVSVTAERGGAVLRVRDYGIGISAAALPHVFERSFRAPEASQHAPGLGLGLSVVADIAAKHGGTITATAASGGGTVMTVRLPLSTHATATVAAAPSGRDAHVYVAPGLDGTSH